MWSSGPRKGDCEAADAELHFSLSKVQVCPLRCLRPALSPIRRYHSLTWAFSRASVDRYVRLAFWIGAHLDPGCLDRRRCVGSRRRRVSKRYLGKMHCVSTDRNRTVLIVSHNLHAVLSLCDCDPGGFRKGRSEGAHRVGDCPIFGRLPIRKKYGARFSSGRTWR